MTSSTTDPAMSPSAPDPAFTAELARHVLRYRDWALPPEASTVARQCVLDWFGVALAGCGEPCASILLDEIGGASAGPCGLVGSGLRLAPADAALYNGTASHALDYDDVNARMMGHPTVAVWPAVLAVAQAERRSGAQALRAFVAGYEAAAAVGTLVCPAHYLAGFHATGTLGAFGAAAAAGLLLDLDEAALRVALGLAGTQAAGLKAMFGTMAKPFHAGKAAANGVLAARLARRGYTAHPQVLETAQGFAATQGRLPLPRGWSLPEPGAEIRSNLFKYHALCYETHSTIESILAARAANGFELADVESVEVHVTAGHLSVCNILEPSTGLQSKFSLRHAAALALAGEDTADIALYSDDNARRADLCDLRRRISVHGDHPDGPVTSVLIRLRSGAACGHSHDSRVPEADLARQERRLQRKFMTLAAPVLGAARAQELAARIGRLDSITGLDELMALARRPSEL